MESPKSRTRGQRRSRPRAPASASAMAAAGHPPGASPLPLLRETGRTGERPRLHTGFRFGFHLHSISHWLFKRLSGAGARRGRAQCSRGLSLSHHPCAGWKHLEKNPGDFYGLYLFQRDFLLRQMQLPHLKDFLLFNLLTTQVGEESVANFAVIVHTLILLILLLL